MDIREQIAVMALSKKYSITDIAERFDVTRPTVYRYRDRFREGGRANLLDRSRAPLTPRRTAESIEQRVIEAATAYATANGYQPSDRTAVGLVIVGMAIGASLSPETGEAMRTRYTEQFTAPVTDWATYIETGEVRP